VDERGNEANQHVEFYPVRPRVAFLLDKVSVCDTLADRRECVNRDVEREEVRG